MEVGLKNALIYIDPSSHFVFYEIFCSLNFWVERHLDFVLEVRQIFNFLHLGKKKKIGHFKKKNEI